jgi:Cu-Zn family superoxide dismutase
MRNQLTGTMIALLCAAAPLSAAADSPGTLKGADGSPVGTVTVTPAPAGVLVRVSAKGLPPGWHGIHFHEKGSCTDAGFKQSGSHVHGGAAPAVHGLLNPAASDAGDLPNVHVAADGTLDVELFTTLVTLDPGGARPALRDADGSALVIHASPDDHKSQPIGGAGARIACAVIP